MVKLEQALILDPPSELHFTPSYTDITTAYLKLTNPTEKNIAFKLKTTAPKTYCVRPNSGIIKPSNTIEVAVMLQPLTAENLENMKHKFMVQSLFAPDGEVNQETLWKEATADNFMNSKLKCVFDIPQSSRSQVDAGDSITDVLDSRNEESASDVPADGREVPTKNVEVELHKAKAMNKRLLDLLKELRNENANLKEAHLRLRRTKAASEGQSEPISESSSPPTMPLANQGSFAFTKITIIISVIALFVGIMIGVKF